MPDHPTASEITDDQLDALRTELDQLRGLRDVVRQEATHWDTDSPAVLRAALAALPAHDTQEPTR